MPKSKKPKWLKDHICSFNDGACECDCFKTAYHQAVQECYLECLAAECGEGVCARAIREQYPDIVTQ